MIDVGVNVGPIKPLTLSRALLVYEAGAKQAYVTMHDILRSENGAHLGVGHPVTTAFVSELAAQLGTRVKPEVLPDYVLCRTAEVVVWWSQAQKRPMFFREKSELGRVNGKVFPHPPLVWRLIGRDLCVRALATNARPAADTPLYRAPYWNTYEGGGICQGTMVSPEVLDINTLRAWEDAYFGSQFTHGAGARDLAKRTGGVVALWRSLSGRGAFPMNSLVPADETLQQFLTRKATLMAHEF